MSQLILKQRSFRLDQRFEVLDRHNNLLYNVTGGTLLPIIDRFFSPFCGIPHTIRIQHATTGETWLLKKQFSGLFESYQLVNTDGESLATIKHGKKMIKTEINVHSLDGDFFIETTPMARDFTIYQADIKVATIQKVLLSMRDSYVLTYDDPPLEPLLIVFVIAIDTMFH